MEFLLGVSILLVCVVLSADVIAISQYKWVVLVITRVQGEAEDEGNN